MDDPLDITGRTAVRELARRRSGAYRQRAQDLMERAQVLPSGSQRKNCLVAATRWFQLAEIQDRIAGSDQA